MNCPPTEASSTQRVAARPIHIVIGSVCCLQLQVFRLALINAFIMCKIELDWRRTMDGLTLRTLGPLAAAEEGGPSGKPKTYTCLDSIRQITRYYAIRGPDSPAHVHLICCSIQYQVAEASFAPDRKGISASAGSLPLSSPLLSSRSPLVCSSLLLLS